MADEKEPKKQGKSKATHPEPPAFFSPNPGPGDNGMPTREQLAHHPIEAAEFRLARATANSTYQDSVQTADSSLASANEALETAQGTYKAAFQTYLSAVQVAQAQIKEDYRTAISTFTKSALGS